MKFHLIGDNAIYTRTINIPKKRAIKQVAIQVCKITVKLDTDVIADMFHNWSAEKVTVYIYPSFPISEK